MAKAEISIPLDIDDVQVLKVEVSQRGDIHITLESSLGYGYCRKCGQKLTKLHSHDGWVKVQHLPSFGRAVFLHYRPKRYECPTCDGRPTTTQQLAWHEPNSPHTTAYDAIVSARLPNGQLTLLAILPDHKKDTVKAFFASIPSALRATITSVCTDLYEGYLQATRDMLPGVRRVIDRFHVARLYRAAADDCRKAELKRLKVTLPANQYRTLKGTLWAFRLASADLQPAQQQLLTQLFALVPTLKQVYQLREALTAIFDHATTRRSAQKQIRAGSAWFSAAVCLILTHSSLRLTASGKKLPITL